MILNFTNSAPTPEQDAAARAAIGPASVFPWADFIHTATVTWVDEPRALQNPHHDHFFAYTVVSGGGSSIVIQLRRTLGLGPDAESGFYRARGITNDLGFVTETVEHELGHVVVAFVDSPEDFPPLFFKSGRGGTWDDYAPADAPWEDWIQEAVVETFKDVFLPGRTYDNRTHWRLPRENFAAFIRKFPRPGKNITPAPVWSISFQQPGGAT